MAIVRAGPAAAGRTDPGTSDAPPSAAATTRAGRISGWWQVLFVCTPVFAAFYLALPTSGLAQTFAYPVFGIIATVAILAGVRWNAPARPRSWGIIAIGLAFLSAGDLVYTLISLVVEDIPYPSLADVAYLIGYGALAIGVTGLARGRMAGGDRVPVIDAAILASGAAAAFWLVVIRPMLEGSVDVLAAAVSLSYPCMDLVLLGLAFRVLLSASGRQRSMQFLFVGLLIYFAADVIYGVAVLEGTYADGNPVDVLWIIGVTLLGVAALHPSAAERPIEVESHSKLSRSRLALLAIAAMVAPGLLVTKAISDGADDVIGLVITWTILFGLVLIRLASTVDDLGLSLLQRRSLQDDLTYQAQHDPLTRLANRTLFEQRLERAMDVAPQRIGLVFLDLDDFKAINDTLGHASGDELLRIVAERIRRELRDADVAARLGGDEFAILIADCPDEPTVRAVAERILATLRAPVNLAGRSFQIRGSAGVAVGRAGSTPMDLMRDADVAMYQAKSHGKDQAENYDPEMHSHVVRSYELRSELAEAIDANQFVLMYQPAIALATDEIIGAEALVRWRHPERGLLAPGDFIPHAESSGLINDLGRWILRDACRTAATWPMRADGSRHVLSVNLAGGQLLQPGLVDEIADILSETGLPAGTLYLEVTESALVDFDSAADALLRLRALGVRLALDDFGTGYSALSYLARLPFDVVKIDREFIASIGGDLRVEALLAGIVVLCRNLELSLCAEGVETVAQLDVIRRLGFAAAQGFLFARPLAADAFAALLVRDHLPAGTYAAAAVQRRFPVTNPAAAPS